MKKKSPFDQSKIFFVSISISFIQGLSKCQSDALYFDLRVVAYDFPSLKNSFFAVNSDHFVISIINQSV